MPITSHVLPKMYSAQSVALHNDVCTMVHTCATCRVTRRNTVSLCRAAGDKVSTSRRAVQLRGDRLAPPGWVAGDGPRPSGGVLGSENTHEVGEQTTLTGTTNA